MAVVLRPRIAEIHEFTQELADLLKQLGAIEVAAETLKPLHARSVIRDVTWSAYQSFLRAIVRKGLRHCYRDGVLELMAPRPFWRESRKSVVRRFAQHLSSEFAINLRSLGRVPIVSPSLRVGVEPDESFAVQLGSSKRQKPNLVIEVADGGPVSKTLAVEDRAISRMRVLRVLGISEVWLMQGESVTICTNQQRRRWKRSETSQFLPGVTSSLLSKHLARSRRVGENDAIRGLLYDASQENGKTR